MDVNNYFTFDGVTSSRLSTYISGEGTYNAPVRVYDMRPIPGKNGALAIDEKRFENIDLTYPAFIYQDSETDFEGKIAALRNELLSRTGYKVLTDTYHPDEFRLAIFKGGLSVTTKLLNKAASFSLTFHCKPQRFLVSGEEAITLTGSGTITNPTMFEAKPLIRITGTGTVEINGVSVTVSESPVTMDCESMEAYSEGISRNAAITLTPNTFPVLGPGENQITMSSGISEIQITPRWWRI